ncbi:MAG: helix-turn-helix domain-containing protein [Candidatus Omnitrophica bacterium]|nr:helix-turn-helix domain-containing protein [Candidatus Omnitrophota bacterium]MDD5355514.1 helix-turn-helix domain-containing protein [Candidatus Omnitrophota bacterium]
MVNNINYKIEDSFPMLGNEDVYENVISHVEKILIERALERSDGNQLMAAKMLGLNRNTLHKKVKKLNIDIEKFKR